MRSLKARRTLTAFEPKRLRPEAMTGSRPAETLHRGPLRWLLLIAGFICTVLGTVGAFVPVLPTTPFLLLAAACFSRSSPRFHRLLLANRIMGPYLVQWQHDHTIPREAKRKAYTVLVITFTSSILLVEGTGLRITLGVIAVALIMFLRWLPTTNAERLMDSDAPE
ncbi:MAG: uncharacterized membrane protein YbaN (DUF454 family) [Planctomycetota bacterium]|jgi:uncharacterized membrane protein YbaN (DUF454 family)